VNGHDLHPLKTNEQILVLQQRARVSLRQFCNSEHASREDAERSEREESNEDLEALIDDASGVAFLHLLLVSKSIVQRQSDEDAERENLEAQSEQSDVHTGLAAAIGAGGHATADTLEDEGDDVADDEEDVVEFRLEACEGRC
jgi:hypothetical protein